MLKRIKLWWMNNRPYRSRTIQPWLLTARNTGLVEGRAEGRKAAEIGFTSERDLILKRLAEIADLKFRRQDSIQDGTIRIEVSFSEQMLVGNLGDSKRELAHYMGMMVERELSQVHVLQKCGETRHEDYKNRRNPFWVNPSDAGNGV